VRIEIPLYDGFDELDGVAPYEVLREAGCLTITGPPRRSYDGDRLFSPPRS